MRVFRLLTYNMFTPVPAPLRVYGQNDRAERVQEILAHFEDVDVVVLNEAIAPQAHANVAQNLRKAGFTYHTQQMQDLFSVPGGVLVYSRHPITQEQHTTFGDHCVGLDCLASKGVVFARVLKEGFYYNVLATHMQAWFTPQAQQARDAQVAQTKHFIDALGIPTHEPVYLVGDLNIDLYADRARLNHVFHELRLDMPMLHPDSHPFTVDPATNQLVGNDDPDEYKSEQWPDGCAEIYYDTLHCPCCPEEWIDYTLFSTRHRLPQRSYMQTLATKVSPFKTTLRLGQTATLQDVSDHYPVLGHFEYDVGPLDYVRSARQVNSSPDNEPWQGDHRQNTATGIICVILGVMLIITVLAWVVTWWVKRPSKPNKTRYVGDWNSLVS